MQYAILGIIIFIIVISIKQINQYERGLRFALGRFTGLMNPGWRLVWPIIQFYKKIDLRVKAVDVPNQEAITKDNISVSVNAVIYYKIREADKSILEVENFYYAISQLAQTTMRNAVGQVDLDGLLSARDKVSENIRAIIDKASDPWGIEVINVELNDVSADQSNTIIFAVPLEVLRAFEKFGKDEKK